MGSIDTYIRAAIKKTNADSPEARNQIYLAARDAIQKLPAEKLDSAMQELFDSVTAIEAEFVRLEMPSHTTGGLSGKKDRSLIGLLSRLNIAWFTILSVAVVMTIIAFSIFLVVTEYRKAGIDLTNPIKSADAVNAEQTLFSISTREDHSKLASDPRGSQKIPEARLIKSEGLWFQRALNLYGINQITIKQGELYLVRMTMKIEPKNEAFSLNAGFSTTDANNEVLRSMFLHTGPVKAGAYRKDQDDFSFSKIVTLEDLSEDLAISGTSASVRPMILAGSQNPDSKILIKSFSVDKL